MNDDKKQGLGDKLTQLKEAGTRQFSTIRKNMEEEKRIRSAIKAKGKVKCNNCEKFFKPREIRQIDGVSYCQPCSSTVIKQKEDKRNSVTFEQTKDIILTTTHSLPGYEIIKYLDLVTVQVVMGVNFLKDIMGSIDSFIGGRSIDLERELSSAYIYAINDLKKEAYLRGADAVIGVEFDSGIEVAGHAGANDKMVIVAGMGTAICIKPSREIA